MKPSRFSYFRPRNAAEAIEMMAAAGDDARFLAGGQSLVPMMNFRIVWPSALIDLSDCADLAYVRHSAGKVHIGSMVRQRDAENDPTIRTHCPLVSHALAHAGPATIRNRATIGGTIANGYPLAQLPVVALCMNAEMILANRTGSRTVASLDFFVAGMTTAIRSDELLREIVLPAAGLSTRVAFVERGNHASGAALAIVAMCAEVTADGRPSVRASLWQVCNQLRCSCQMSAVLSSRTTRIYIRPLRRISSSLIRAGMVPRRMCNSVILSVS